MDKRNEQLFPKRRHQRNNPRIAGVPKEEEKGAEGLFKEIRTEQWNKSVKDKYYMLSLTCGC